MQLGKKRRDLTPRQKEIISLMCFTNLRIASKLGIAEQTVKNHITEINRRLGTQCREQILVYCLRNGEIKLEEIKYQ